MSEKISSVRSVQEIKFNEQQPNNKIFYMFFNCIHEFIYFKK